MTSIELFEGRHGTQAKARGDTTDYVYLFTKKDGETADEYSARVLSEFKAAYPEADTEGDEECISRFEPVEFYPLGLFEE